MDDSTPMVHLLHFPPNWYRVTGDNELLLPDGRKVGYLLHPDLWEELAASMLGPDKLGLQEQIFHLANRVAEEYEINRALQARLERLNNG